MKIRATATDRVASAMWDVLCQSVGAPPGTDDISWDELVDAAWDNPGVAELLRDMRRQADAAISALPRVWLSDRAYFHVVMGLLAAALVAGSLHQPILLLTFTAMLGVAIVSLPSEDLDS